MPKKPDKPCSYPGCPNLVPAGQSFCKEHMKQMNQRYERYGRDREAKRKYGRQWERIRKPLSEGGTHDEDNLMSLCKRCHSKIHAERGDRWNR